MEEKRGVDRRLGESLKELAKKMPFEKITVRQIAEGAGVIRATFYNHFQDKYSLLEWILRTEILDPVALLLEHAMFREAIVLIFANMRKDREFYMRLTYMEGQNSFREVVGLGIRRLLLPVFDVRGKTLEHVWMRPECLADYYARSMTFVIVEWIRTGMVVTPETGSPLMTLHWTGAAPRYLGSSEPWRLTQPYRGRSSTFFGRILP